MFEWDENKYQINLQKHGVSFQQARKAFFDPKRLIIEDTAIVLMNSVFSV
jgi:uncharacterized DUF497 family protein